ERAALHGRFLELLEAGSVGAPAVAGNRVFTLEREGDADQAVVVMRSAVDADVPPRVLVDPHRLAPDHAAAVDWLSPSPDGRLLAYGVSEAGSQHGVLLGDGLDRTALPVTTISPDGRWLVLHVHLMPTRTDVILADRATGRRTVVVEGEEAWTWCQVVADRLYAVTSLGAPRGRVIAASTERPQPEHWVDVVPEGTAVVESVVVAGDS